MARRGNNMLPNAHFHKHWQRRIKTWFNQPARKQRRRLARLSKAARVAPRPVGGLLRPIVHCPTIRYNSKLRLGRGFTLDELKAAGFNKYEAKSLGIAIDYRRTNRSVESIERNAKRLKEYRSRLIIFPKKLSNPKKGDSSPEELKLASQVAGKVVMPHKEQKPRLKAQPLTDELKNFKVYCHLRRVRADASLKGKRDKKAKEAADEGLGKGGR
ncbi:60S ribosomal protein L13 [Meloidogyne graminicola]|uniref:60S ribosomal protein L13 n=1 Tax=Meloidogyne graminicola TaxID=189291 RepID=A0A8S9ZSZ4_9BILA|nr:60S ribosomal protein L13 [Meloidogyne graminicola]